VVAARGLLEGCEPQAGDAQSVQVIEPAAQPFEVADAVAVRVHEGADVQAVDDGVLVPEVLDHRSWVGLPEEKLHGQYARARAVERVTDLDRRPRLAAV